MKQLLGLVVLGSIVIPSLALANEKSLVVVYPRNNHKTTAEKIFFLGTAPPQGKVSINGKVIVRSQSGHFAPSLPLQLGENLFTVSYENQTVQVKVIRNTTQAVIPQGLAFAKDSLTPAVDIARMPGELICFSAIAAPNGTVSVQLGERNISLLPQNQQVQLPSNFAALTGQNQPNVQKNISKYQGCTKVDSPGNLGKPKFQLTLDGESFTQEGTGNIQILSPQQLSVAEVNVDAGVARTGPSTNYSRLTPLPQGTQATITGKEGEWLRLDYGAWIKSKETQIISNIIPPRSIIRSVGYKQLPQATEMTFPLEVPVPVSVQQGNKTFTLTLYNTTAQTDTIRTDDDPLISRLDWQEVAPGRLQYTFNLKTDQQWGYKLKYQGTSLVLTLRHPPKLKSSQRKPLSGIKILLDPGHGGKESGAIGHSGYKEKDVNLVISLLLRQELIKRGATVVMTREDDRDVSLVARQQMIAKEEPAIAFSIHYNSLPDAGDAENIQGIGMFWYHPQAHSLAVFMHNYLVKKRKRPTYGVFWNNLALTRPAEAPSILLELGFMSNPEEFEWVMDEKEQKKLAKAMADGVVKWFKDSR
ncbi:N-acetylmuramoyl-L-alanine amidase [Calothrix rhizosoleniae]|uniref:N-acetylmuramoyl-L-alanine amidase n=1 Tax=Calothrix rhizosoleniae TaxID=888997 RepID=UPI000B4A3A8A|nr:N-acetylmuramoyl-L-alanine amidase [Calothrix rhizosoleniae]